MIRHRILPAILAVILSLSLLGCGGSDFPPDLPSDLPPDPPGEMTSQTAPAEKTGAVAELPELEQPTAPERGENVPAADTLITLAADGSKVEGEGATVDGNVVTVTAPGSYLVTGSLSDGKIAVDVSEKEKVTLILDGVSVGNTAGSALGTTIKAQLNAEFTIPGGAGDGKDLKATFVSTDPTGGINVTPAGAQAPICIPKVKAKHAEE